MPNRIVRQPHSLFVTTTMHQKERNQLDYLAIFAGRISKTAADASFDAA